MKTMLFNPYNGLPRHPSDIASDPAGLLMVDPDEPLRAAQPASTQAIAEALIRLDGIYRSLIDDEYAPQPPWLRDALQLAGQAQPSPEVSTQAVVTDAEALRRVLKGLLDGIQAGRFVPVDTGSTGFCQSLINAAEALIALPETGTAPPAPEERELTDEAQAERDQFERTYSGCSCHLSPPCNSCTHPGNPLNQDEDETAWKPSAAAQKLAADIRELRTLADRYGQMAGAHPDERYTFDRSGMLDLVKEVRATR